MSEEPSAPPSEEEVREAQLVLQRHRAAVAEAEMAKLTPLIELANGPEVAALTDKVTALPEDLQADARYRPHLRALEAGLAALSKVAARFPPAEG